MDYLTWLSSTKKDSEITLLNSSPVIMILLILSLLDKYKGSCGRKILNYRTVYVDHLIIENSLTTDKSFLSNICTDRNNLRLCDHSELSNPIYPCCHFLILSF